MTKERIEQIADKNGWKVFWDDGYAEFEKYSPAGEDFIFTVDTTDEESIIPAIYDYAYIYYDADEHAEEWIKARDESATGVPDLRTLIEDADAIQDMLREFCDVLKEEGGYYYV